MVAPQWAHRATAANLARGADTSWVHHMLDVIDARLDLADQRLIVVLALRLAGADELPHDLRAAIDHSLLKFRYALEDVGDDSMCTWTENHQVMFGAAEYLVGQLHPQETFVHSRMTGEQHRDRAHHWLDRWLEDRFRYGFSEWLSATYYELDIAALTLLVEHADDPELATRASMVLDLLFLDLALHRFEGRFVSSEGRAYRKPKMDPAKAEVNGILAAAFGRPPLFDPQTLTGVFVGRSAYQVPRVLAEIAVADGAHLIKSSHGRDVDEVLAAVAARHPDPLSSRARDDRLRSLWSMQAFTLPQTITMTLEAVRRLALVRNRYLAPLAPFAKLKSERVVTTILRGLHPITRGLTLQRANVLTHRTPHHLLSSAQQYHPGEFGDQQHLWHASLPGDLCVFGTHPGATVLGSEARTATPSAWVGNGVNPDVAQVDSVVLVLHDLRVRKGHLEARRHELSHLFFPFVKFDETTISGRVVAGRKGDSFIGIVALNQFDMVSEDELLQRGQVTGWAVVLSDRGEYSSLPEFSTMLKASRLRHVRDTLRFEADLGLGGAGRRRNRLELRWRKGFKVDGALQNTAYPRYDCTWVQAPRGASSITVTGRECALELDWTNGTRREL